MTGQIFKVSALGLLLALLVGCGFGNDAVIEGSVYDNFNQPLRSASVEILDSSFRAETDSKGKFRIPYVPGNLKVKISAPGYTSRVIQLDLNQFSKYPLDDSVLAKIPEADGIYLIGSKSYVPLALSKIGEIQISRGMTPTNSYYVQTTDSWARVEAELIEELSILAQASESNEVAFVDRTAGNHVPLALSGSRLGEGSGDPFNGGGFEILNEELVNMDKFYIRNLSYPVSQLIEGKMLCFAPMGKNILGVQMIRSESQAYCISGSRAGFKEVRVRDPVPEEFAQVPIDALQRNAAAMEKAEHLFGVFCKGCHGGVEPRRGGGTDLTHGLPLTKGDVSTISLVMQRGFSSIMPPLKAQLGNQGVKETTNFVLSLGGEDHNPKLAHQGEKHFDKFCVACHGRDGTGNIQLWVPDLTDDKWIYGNSESEIASVIENGANRSMPSCNQMQMSDAQCQVLAAYAQRFHSIH